MSILSQESGRSCENRGHRAGHVLFWDTLTEPRPLALKQSEAMTTLEEVSEVSASPKHLLNKTPEDLAVEEGAWSRKWGKQVTSSCVPYLAILSRGSRSAMTSSCENSAISLEANH